MSRRRLFLAILIFCGAVLAASSSAASGKAEQERDGSAAALAAFDAALSLGDRRAVKQASGRERDRLTPRQRELYDERRRLKEKAVYWDDVVRLKADLLKMPGASDEREAETIAKIGIRGFADLKEKYDMLRPALLHNLLVNMKLKGEGLCWEWTRDMTKKLMGLGLKNYDVLWASARQSTIREHNVPVVVSKGHPLEDGIFLDGWTKSGKPYWSRIPDDPKHHPWKPSSYWGNDMAPEPPPPDLP